MHRLQLALCGGGGGGVYIAQTLYLHSGWLPLATCTGGLVYIYIYIPLPGQPPGYNCNKKPFLGYNCNKKLYTAQGRLNPDITPQIWKLLLTRNNKNFLQK